MDLRLYLGSGVALDPEFVERMFRGHIEADSAVAFQQRRTSIRLESSTTFCILHMVAAMADMAMLVEDQGLSFGTAWRYCPVKMLQCITYVQYHYAML